MKTSTIVTFVGIVIALILGVVAINKHPSIIAGSAVGPDRYNPCESRDGVQECTKSMAYTQATTTICAQKVTATSTLEQFTNNFVTSSTSAAIVYLATSTSAFATTTNLATYNISANESDGFTYIGGAKDVIFPNTWLVVGMTGGTGTFSPTGSCKSITQTL